MSHVLNENGCYAEILLENGAQFLSLEDRQLIECALSKENIVFTCIDLRNDHQDSQIREIDIIINENLTSSIIGGLLMPGVYDTIKSVLNIILRVIKNGLVKIASKNKTPVSALIFKFSTKKGYIEAPIPENLSDIQFQKYMDSLISAIQSLTHDEINKDYLNVEFKPEDCCKAEINNAN